MFKDKRKIYIIKKIKTIYIKFINIIISLFLLCAIPLPSIRFLSRFVSCFVGGKVIIEKWNKQQSITMMICISLWKTKELKSFFFVKRNKKKIIQNEKFDSLERNDGTESTKIQRRRQQKQKNHERNQEEKLLFRYKCNFDFHRTLILNALQYL